MACDSWFAWRDNDVIRLALVDSATPLLRRLVVAADVVAVALLERVTSLFKEIARFGFPQSVDVQFPIIHKHLITLSAKTTKINEYKICSNKW